MNTMGFNHQKNFRNVGNVWLGSVADGNPTHIRFKNNFASKTQINILHKLPSRLFMVVLEKLKKT